MKAILLPAAILLVIANALLLVPTMAPYAPAIAGVAAVLALVVLGAALAGRGGGGAAPSAPSSPAPAPPAAPKNQAEAEVVTFLAVLQEKGRLVDFLMDDITAYDDAQIGAAARVVHEGCQAALKEHLTVEPIAAGSQEGEAFTVPPDHPADAYRLTGKIQGEPPFTGTLVHKGWQATSVRLPRILKPAEGTLPTIAPAEVELG